MRYISKCFRLIAFLALPGLCAGSETPPLTDAESLAEVLRVRLPKGWTILVKDEQVVLERMEPVELYNGLALPGFNQEAEIKRRIFRVKLRITLRLGEHVTTEDFKQFTLKNDEAIDKVRKDRSDGKYMPDAKFWKEHPEYGFRELPILDAGRQSIYMESTFGCIRAPTDDPRSAQAGGRIMNFFDRRTDEECQGLIDGLGKLFRPYQ